MFKKKLIDTVEELDHEYLKSPTLYDPFRNAPISTKKLIASNTNKRLQAVMFDDADDFGMRDDNEHRFDYSLDCNESKSPMKITPLKSHDHNTHPLEESLITLSNSLMQF